MRERKDTVLLIEDRETDRVALRRLLEGDYNLLEAESKAQAVLLLDGCISTVTAVVLSMDMDGEAAVALLEQIRADGRRSHLPVLAVLATHSSEAETRAFGLGVCDVLVKPLEYLAVTTRLRNMIDLDYYKRHMEVLVEEQAQRLRETNGALTDALSSVIEYRSLESGQHVMRIRMFTKLLLRRVAKNCPEYPLDEHTISIISQAASMHDIGKIAIPDAILNKPAKLDVGEFETMKTHTLRGCDLLESVSGLGDREFLSYAYSICRYHHERWDGKGYPDGLQLDNIPICAQVVGIADCYDALTTDRPYKKAYTHETAINMILNGECGTFSPKLLECLKEIRGQFQDMARQYADGSKLGVALHIPGPDGARVEGRDSLQVAQAKYFLMLRYLNCTVLEVDADSGIYHMIYTPDTDFDVMRTGGTFEEVVERFYKTSVHPDDLAATVGSASKYLKEFFRTGMMQRSRLYRVFSKSGGVYRWHRCTTMRLDAENPRRHRAIVIWRCVEDEQSGFVPEGAQSDDVSDHLPCGVFTCRNDAELSIVHASEGFSRMFGFTQQEIQAQFGGSFLQMVVQEDRNGLVQSVATQLSHNRMTEHEYRVSCRDGSSLWVMGKANLVEEGSEERFYCILMDMTRVRHDQEKLRLSLERHEIIMNQANDIIFEWDIVHDKVSYSHNWEKKFGYNPLSERYQEMFSVASHIYPADKLGLLEMMNAVRNGRLFVEIECRVAKADGRYIWCRIRATTQVDADGTPLKAVGVIADIDEERRQSEHLRAKAERDVLTGLYNKQAARQQVEAHLGDACAEQGGALLILDADNFKQINDNYGHMFGDAVLTQMAQKIQDTFGSDGIVSRIGGDEFLAFLPSRSEGGTVQERAERFITAICELAEGAGQACALSCSVGIAYAPDHGRTYQELFEKADRALYRAKKQGKNCFVVYDNSMTEQTFAEVVDNRSALGAHIDSDEASDISEIGMVHYAFQRLYRSSNVTEAVDGILRLVGERFGVSRAYIFENTDDNLYCRNTFEWCKKGIKPQRDKLTMISYADDLGGTYHKNFDENGVFYCPDIAKLPAEQYEVLAPQGIKSMLQCAIRDRGAFRGYVGFDENTTNRLWTQEQIDAFSLVSEMLGVFLLKQRAQERAERTAKNLSLMLDNQNAWIYLIDPETYQLFYINERTQQTAPQARVGMCCYKAFFNRDTPCEICPARGIRGKRNCIMEIYNPVFQIWTETDSSLVKWGDRDACLLTSHDITHYKCPQQ